MRSCLYLVGQHSVLPGDIAFRAKVDPASAFFARWLHFSTGPFCATKACKCWSEKLFCVCPQWKLVYWWCIWFVTGEPDGVDWPLVSLSAALDWHDMLIMAALSSTTDWILFKNSWLIHSLPVGLPDGLFSLSCSSATTTTLWAWSVITDDWCWVQAFSMARLIAMILY